MKKKSLISYLATVLGVTLLGTLAFENPGHTDFQNVVMIPLSIPMVASYEFSISVLTSYDFGDALNMDFDQVTMVLFIVVSLVLNCLLYIPILRFETLRKFLMNQATVLASYFVVSLPFFLSIVGT